MPDDPTISASLRLDRTFVAVQSEQEIHCMLELGVPAPVSASERPPLNLALVLDCSGSMMGEKLDWTKEAASHLIRRLAPTDRLALVAFETEVELIDALAPVNVDQALAAIELLDVRGTTNLSGGWLKGVEELRRAPSGGPRKILLLTDGQANVGIVDPAQLGSMANTMRDAAGISTTTIGFGEDFEEDLLAAMADASGGNAHYVERPDRAPAIFAEEFDDLAALVAQNLSVEVRPSGDVAGLAIMNEFPQVSVEGGVQVQLGDAYGNERRRVVFKLHIPGLADLGPRRVADIVLRYVGVGERIEQHEITLPLEVNLVSADDPQADIVDRDVVDEVIVLRAAAAQQRAMEHLDRGEIDEARKLLSATADDLERIAEGSEQEVDLRARAERMKRQLGELEDEGYSPGMRKELRYEERAMRLSRMDDQGRRKRR